MTPNIPLTEEEKARALAALEQAYEYYGETMCVRTLEQPYEELPAVA